MTEKNRHILKQTLNDLPGKKAGKSNWAGISGSLDELDGNRFLSNNLSSLPGYKAPESAWAGIQAGMSRSWYVITAGGAIKIGSLAVVITALIIGAVFLFSDRSEKSDQTQSEIISETTNIPYSKIDQPEEKRLPALANEDGNKIENRHSLPAKTITENATIASGNKKKKTNSSTKTVPEYLNSLAPDQQYLEQQCTPKEGQELMGLTGKSISSVNHERALLNRKKLNHISSEDDYYEKPQHVDISFEIYYSLLNFQNGDIPQMELPESASSFGFEVMMEYRKFFFKTGLSYLSLEDKAQYTFNYKQEELVYSYNYVDSALYNPFTESVDYYTTHKNVYDSVAHQQADQIRYRYRVLQVPLIAGYKLIHNNQFMISINGGVGADIRLGGKSFIPVFNESNSSITGTENHLEYRFGLNWRMMAGFGLYYKISGSFYFYFEPTYHAYLKSVYENASLDKATYIEFKSGLIYKF
ncbi:MAG: hypothetical protein K9G67_12915 [Bacteroidales bacterium]|nr:hypothetical protein [Bacteroidales bacterium]MCF8350580.1 hypothetical protein [Bacteroidales bacterium]MCF8377252.1 hypothetical protein [Bacteroidales bacterium]MCF8401998.1 hypothetical protein [Bacteroidales bacterium]